MKMVEIDLDIVHKAYRNWRDFCHKKEHKIKEKAFLDFIDPVRQTNVVWWSEDDGGFVTYDSPIEVTEQVFRRIQLLSGPNHYAYLTANIDRFKHAHVSWGKK